MKKLVAVLLVFGLLFLAVAAPAMAGASTDAALALGAFAVLNQFLRGETIFNSPSPQPRVYAPVPPPPQARWVSGHWESRWVPAQQLQTVWVPGHWTSYGWVEGHWEQHVSQGGYAQQTVWVPGYWEPY